LSKIHGYTGKILRINLNEGIDYSEPISIETIKHYLGGRGFNAYRLYMEVNKGIDPLGPKNKLMFATGPLVGTMFPTASRFNVSAKSPLTGIFGDSNAGGHFAPEMKYAGYDQIILEGKAKFPVYIYIKNDKTEIIDASIIWGKDVITTDEIIKDELDDTKIQTVICGPAAEKGIKFAGLFANQIRAASRTGMGTVMASKNVKALAIRGTGSISVAQPHRFKEYVLKIEDEIRKHEQYPGRRLMGTTRILMMANQAGFLPTYNYLKGTYDQAEKVSGEKLAAEYNVKSRACFACTIPCSRIYTVRNGKYKGLHGEGPEYEALGSFTSRIGNPDLELALKAIDLCNRLGLDALSVAGSIGWAMELYEKGILNKKDTFGLELTWGNPESILILIEQIAGKKEFGRILADGTHKAVEKLGKGEDSLIQVKGMDLIMADPRGLKGFGLGYAVASRGGDHLRSEPFIELSDDPSIGERMFGVPGATLRRSDHGKGKLVSYFEDWCAVVDSLEPCKNMAQNMELLPFDRASEIMRIVTGIEFSPEDMRNAGARIVTIERMFGVREGITRDNDTLPSRFTQPLTEGNSRGQIVNLDLMLDEYYDERGWDKKTGIPTQSTLKRLGLSFASTT
jgi:aldehyde:ferredoxin oxidoreductase